MAEKDGSPWGAGRLGRSGRPRLLFGATYEDVDLDDEVLAGAHRVFVIGASGDTAMRLARSGRSVHAVDVNGAQVEYLRSRLDGGSRRWGVADRLLSAARRLAPVAGWTGPRVRCFLQMSDVDRQRQVFDEFLDTARFRALMDLGFAPAVLLRAYRPEFVAFLPRRFGQVLQGRLRRGVATHANRPNPYAHLLFAGLPPVVGLPAGPVEVCHAEAAAFLDARPEGSYDGFALSNLLDGPDAADADRLARAVARAGQPNSPVVLRTLREPPDEQAAAWAARDRSMIWGGIVVTTASGLPDAVRSLA